MSVEWLTLVLYCRCKEESTCTILQHYGPESAPLADRKSRSHTPHEYGLDATGNRGAVRRLVSIPVGPGGGQGQHFSRAPRPCRAGFRCADRFTPPVRGEAEAGYRACGLAGRRQIDDW